MSGLDAICKSTRVAMVGVVTLGLAVGGCTGSGAGGSNASGAVTTAAATPVTTNPCTAGPKTLESTLVSSPARDDTSVYCFAWQEFVALNWQADPANPGYPNPKALPASFGTPGDTSPKVWESYMEASAVFTATPMKGTWQARRPASKVLSRTSKFGAADLSDIYQAGSGHHWLTNARGDLTYYEIMMNRDEYEFITTQDLTTAAGQLACASQPGKYLSDGPPGPPPPGALMRGGLTMPEGQSNGWDDTDCEGNIKTYGDHVGAMEVKASWTPLPADHSLDYRYKTAIAEIVDPTTKAKRQVTVGLVGLHIARKTVAFHQWIWATFEQIDNTPDEAAGGGFAAPTLPANPNQKPSPGYTFFDPKCDPKTNAFKCVHNAPPTPCPAAPGGTCQPFTAPMQITRVTPVSATANGVTAYFWSLLPAKSVFNYYRLVGVQWPTDSGNPLPAGQRLPLPQGTPSPKGAAGGTAQILADATLESFQQTQAGCMDCHANYTSIASATGLRASAAGGWRKVSKVAVGAQQPYASDYSFLFLTETKR